MRLKLTILLLKSQLGTSSGFKSQYARLQKNPQANKAIQRLADGTLKIGDKNVKKIRGMKTVYEAKTKNTRVYFQVDDNGIVQVLLPALKTDQKKSIKLLQTYFN